MTALPVAWLIARASGLVAFGLLTLSVWLGLAMSTRLLGPKRQKRLLGLHRTLAWTGLSMVGLHIGAILLDPRKHQKIDATRGGVPDPLARRSGEVKAARVTDLLIKIGKQVRKDRLDLVADPVVVCDKRVPVDAAIGQGGFRHAADDGDLRFQMLAWRCNEPGGGMHHRHAVFDSHRLPSAGLHIDIAARQARED